MGSSSFLLLLLFLARLRKFSTSKWKRSLPLYPSFFSPLNRTANTAALLLVSTFLLPSFFAQKEPTTVLLEHFFLSMPSHFLPFYFCPGPQKELGKTSFNVHPLAFFNKPRAEKFNFLYIWARSYLLVVMGFSSGFSRLRIWQR